MLSDVVGERITTWRKRRGWSRERLAEECAKFGAAKLTAESLTNIETGRRQGGVRRRMVTVDELAVIASALNLAPVSLLIPYPDQDRFDFPPLGEVSAAFALAWFSGESSFIDRRGETAFGHQDGYPGGKPFGWLRVHQVQVRARLDLARDLRALTRKMAGAGGEGETFERLRDKGIMSAIDEADRAIVQLRGLMTHSNIPIPELPDELSYLDDRLAHEPAVGKGISLGQVLKSDPQGGPR